MGSSRTRFSAARAASTDNAAAGTSTNAPSRVRPPAASGIPNAFSTPASVAAGNVASGAAAAGSRNLTAIAATPSANAAGAAGRKTARAAAAASTPDRKRELADGEPRTA